MSRLRITQQSLLELDIDERIAQIWFSLDEARKNGNLEDYEFLGAVLRAAYAQGYVDALTEPYGKLQTDHGYVAPEPFDAKTK